MALIDSNEKVGKQLEIVVSTIDSRAIFSLRRDRRTDRFFHPAGDNALNRQSDRRLTPPCRG